MDNPKDMTVADQRNYYRDQLELVKASNLRLDNKLQWYADVVKKLLVHCPESECTRCSEIVCPYHDPLHLHHDGCPSCEREKKPDLTKTYVPSDRDYKQDFTDENGNYMHECRECQSLFVGHKRRPSLCALCKKRLEDEPCNHPGCKSHVSHPCEACGTPMKHR